jgi:hypothetical protein
VPSDADECVCRSMRIGIGADATGQPGSERAATLPAPTPRVTPVKNG